MSNIELDKYKLKDKKTTADSTAAASFSIQKITAFFNKDIQLSSDKLKFKNKEHFYSELAILLAAGVDIKTALELIYNEIEKPKLKAVFGMLNELVISGSSLSEAVNQTGKFTTYEYHTLRIGEESGRIIEVLNDLSEFYQNQIKQRRQLVSALSYPTIVLFTAFGVVFFMMNVVVPMFADIFKRFNHELPFITRTIMRISGHVANYSIYFIVLLLTGIGVLRMQRNKKWFRHYGTQLLLKLPLIGNLIQKIFIARFCHSMHLLIESKTPLVTAIELTKKMVQFYPIEVSLAIVQEEVIKGIPLHRSLSKFSIYNKRMLSLLKVAEETNQLNVIFEKLAKQYQEEVDHQTAIMGTLIEPIMIIFIAVFVAVILIAMYLPLFQLGSSFNQ